MQTLQQTVVTYKTNFLKPCLLINEAQSERVQMYRKCFGEAAQSKPEQLCSTPVPAMPVGTEKNDIIFFWWMQTFSDWPRVGEAGSRR